MVSNYNPAKHDSPLICQKCKAKNAPKKSDEYTNECHDCGFQFEAPVSVGDTVTVEIVDMHQSGRGVGRLPSGYVVLVDGELPASGDEKKRTEVKISNVMDSFAEADTVIESETYVPEEEKTEETEEENPRLGDRSNHWG